MKNKFIILFILSLVCSVFVHGQTTSISIGSITANPGEEINVPIDVSDLTDIGAITLYIGYDPAVLTFQGLNNVHPEVAGITGNANAGQIGLAWIASPPNFANIISGKMLDLNFIYIGGSCDLVFNAGCELVNSLLVTVPVNYSNGTVGPASQPITATIGSVTSSPGDEVFIPVDVIDFLDVGAITLFIGYDESVLTFIGLENINSEVAGTLGNATTSPTQVEIAWVASPPVYANIAAGKLFDLKFVYNGGACDVTFNEDCEVSDSGLVPINVSYFDGDISQASTSITAELATVTASLGQEVLVPLDVTNFSDVAALTFYIGYDPAVLSFVGLESIAPEVAGIQANTITSPDQIVIAWNDMVNFFNFTGKLFDLKFVYNGGTSDLTFDPGCEVTNSLLQPLPVTYFDGLVSVSLEVTTISIDTVYVDPGFEVLVPVNTIDFLDIGAMTLFIEYDPLAFSFIGLENINTEISGVAANTMTGPDRIAIAWTATSPNFANIATGKLFDLKFVFNGGDGNLAFSAGCELTNSILVVVPTTLIDGGVFAPLYANFKAFLQGPYNGSTMEVTLNSELPLNQPYNVAPWFYTGTETVSSIPSASIVDWILIELRETPFGPTTATEATVIARKAGFIMDDGTIVDSETLTPIRFNVVVSYNLYGVIWHRNHLGVMSSVPMVENTGIQSYDFTIAEDQAYGTPNPQVEITTGVWGMASGDGNNDGTVDINDKIDIWSTMVGQTGYKQGDFNLDSQVDNCDKNGCCICNLGNQSGVPD